MAQTETHLDKEGLEYLWGKIVGLAQAGDQQTLSAVAALLTDKADKTHSHPIDTAISEQSTNPVQNRAVARALNKIRREEDSPIPTIYIETLD